MSAVQVTKIDDRDPSVIRSPGDWSNGGNGKEYLGTTTRTNRLGASLTIPFSGTKILIYGTVDSAELGETPTSLFSVDGSRATQFIGTQFPNDQNYQQKFYESPDLDPGAHSLLITVSAAPSVKASFTFDWAEIYNGNAIEDGTSSPSEGSASSTVLPFSSSTLSSESFGTSEVFSTTPTNIVALSPATTTTSSNTLALTVINVQSTVPPSTSSLDSTPRSETISLFISTSATSALLAPAQTDQPQSSPDLSSPLKPRSHIPVVIGAILGAMALIAMLLGVILYTMRKRYKRKVVDTEVNLCSSYSELPESSPVVTPFMISPKFLSYKMLQEAKGAEFVSNIPFPVVITRARLVSKSEEVEQEHEQLPPDYNTIQ